MPQDKANLLQIAPLKLPDLLSQYDTPDYLGAMLVGSQAKADDLQDELSDIDLIFFASSPPSDPDDRYRLSFWQDRLVSKTVTTIADTMESFSNPQLAIQNIEGLRHAIILRDTTGGALTKIQTAALDFEWTDTLCMRADQQASYHLSGCAEEVHKILGALKHDDIATNLQRQGRLLAGLKGLTLLLPQIVALKYRILCRSENLLLYQIQETLVTQSKMGAQCNWFGIYKRCMEGQLTARAMAALELYEATSVLCLPWAHSCDNLAEQKEVIRQTLKRIESCLNRRL